AFVFPRQGHRSVRVLETSDGSFEFFIAHAIFGMADCLEAPACRRPLAFGGTRIGDQRLQLLDLVGSAGHHSPSLSITRIFSVLKIFNASSSSALRSLETSLSG